MPPFPLFLSSLVPSVSSSYFAKTRCVRARRPSRSNGCISAPRSVNRAIALHCDDTSSNVPLQVKAETIYIEDLFYNLSRPSSVHSQRVLRNSPSVSIAISHALCPSPAVALSEQQTPTSRSMARVLKPSGQIPEGKGTILLPHHLCSLHYFKWPLLDGPFPRLRGTRAQAARRPFNLHNGQAQISAIS
jgi:hypothetical protein